MRIPRTTFPLPSNSTDFSGTENSKCTDPPRSVAADLKSPSPSHVVAEPPRRPATCHAPLKFTTKCARVGFFACQSWKKPNSTQSSRKQSWLGRPVGLMFLTSPFGPISLTTAMYMLSSSRPSQNDPPASMAFAWRSMQNFSMRAAPAHSPSSTTPSIFGGADILGRRSSGSGKTSRSLAARSDKAHIATAAHAAADIMFFILRTSPFRVTHPRKHRVHGFSPSVCTLRNYLKISTAPGGPLSRTRMVPNPCILPMT